jgi:DNA (cytosine-5)-methyltransferase 1
MKEKINVIDLFCGCGGISEGFRLAGFNIIGGLDFNEESVKTYQKNFPKAKANLRRSIEF